MKPDRKDYWHRTFLLFSGPVIRTLGQICAKAGALRAEATGNPFQAFLVTSYVLLMIRSVLWVFVLQEFDLKFAYSFMALSYITVLAAGYFIFGETVGIRELGGALMICLGVSLIGFGESKAKKGPV